MKPQLARRLESGTLALVGVGLVAIVVMTFLTSYDAVSHVAASRGAVSPRLAFTIPLAIDGLIVAASAAAWLEALRSGRWHWYPLLLVAAAGTLSVVANVAHAETDDVLARVLAGVPPVALLATVELGAWLIRRAVHRAADDRRSVVVADGRGKAAGGAAEASQDGEGAEVPVAQADRTAPPALPADAVPPGAHHDDEPERVRELVSAGSNGHHADLDYERLKALDVAAYRREYDRHGGTRQALADAYGVTAKTIGRHPQYRQIRDDEDD